MCENEHTSFNIVRMEKYIIQKSIETISNILYSFINYYRTYKEDYKLTKIATDLSIILNCFITRHNMSVLVSSSPWE